MKIKDNWSSVVNDYINNFVFVLMEKCIFLNHEKNVTIKKIHSQIYQGVVLMVHHSSYFSVQPPTSHLLRITFKYFLSLRTQITCDF